MMHTKRCGYFFRASKLVAIATVSTALSWLPTPPKAEAQSCNPFGCSQPGAGECNPFGCPNPGASACTPFGCPATPTPQNSNPGSSSNGQRINPHSHDFQVVNSANQEINYLYMSPASEDSWGEELLGNNTLPPGQGWNLRLTGGCAYDILVEFEDGTQKQRAIDTCRYRTVRFTR